MREIRPGAKRVFDLTDKPKLSLPNKPELAEKPQKSVAPKAVVPLGAKETLATIVTQEFERAGFSKSLTFDAVMARITADDALFRNIALNMIQHECRKRIKNRCRRRQIEQQIRKEMQGS
jgi:hypothetical protein